MSAVVALALICACVAIASVIAALFAAARVSAAVQDDDEDG